MVCVYVCVHAGVCVCVCVYVHVEGVWGMCVSTYMNLHVVKHFNHFVSDITAFMRGTLQLRASLQLSLWTGFCVLNYCGISL